MQYAQTYVATPVELHGWSEGGEGGTGAQRSPFPERDVFVPAQGGDVVSARAVTPSVTDPPENIGKQESISNRSAKEATIRISKRLQLINSGPDYPGSRQNSATEF